MSSTSTRLVEHIAVRENRIPVPLKMVVYRSIETALKAIGAAGEATDVNVALQTEDHDLTLVDEENGGVSAPAHSRCSRQTDRW